MDEKRKMKPHKADNNNMPGEKILNRVNVDHVSPKGKESVSVVGNKLCLQCHYMCAAWKGERNRKLHMISITPIYQSHSLETSF